MADSQPSLVVGRRELRLLFPPYTLGKLAVCPTGVHYSDAKFAVLKFGEN